MKNDRELATAPIPNLIQRGGHLVCIGLFSDDPEVDALMLYAYVILFISVAALQGIKRPMFAVYIGLFRQIAAPIIVFYVLTRVYDFGLMGVWRGIFGITWTAAGIAVVYARQTIKQLDIRS